MSLELIAVVESLVIVWLFTKYMELKEAERLVKLYQSSVNELTRQNDFYMKLTSKLKDQLAEARGERKPSEGGGIEDIDLDELGSIEDAF